MITRMTNRRNITGLNCLFIKIFFWFNSIWLAFKHIRNPILAFKTLRDVKGKMNEFMLSHKVQKMAMANGRFYWDMYTPGFPSKAHASTFLGELNRITQLKAKSNRLRIIFFGITKKCTLDCAHCYEWDVLNEQEVLSSADLQAIVMKFQEEGVGQVHLGGGEPMLRYNDIIDLLHNAEAGTEFWIATSGRGLDQERAAALKKAGLTGVAVSLDHFDADTHNRFRGSSLSYTEAIQAMQYASRARLVVTATICPSKDFLSFENLLKYTELAASLNASFIQIFEPVAVGRYAGENVTFKEKEYAVLDDFYEKLNFSKAYKDLPLIFYQGYYQRRIGCLGSGNRYLYVDTEGMAHSCPFCRNGNNYHTLARPLDEILSSLKSSGCTRFRNANL